MMQPECARMFAAEVRDEMNRQNLTYYSFAKRCGVSRQYISRVITGSVPIGLNVSLKLAEGLGMKVILCLGDKDE